MLATGYVGLNSGAHVLAGAGDPMDEGVRGWNICILSPPCMYYDLMLDPCILQCKAIQPPRSVKAAAGFERENETIVIKGLYYPCFRVALA